MSEPRSEPEIIPPDRSRPEWARDRSGPWATFEAHGTRRIYVRKIGPMGILLLALLIGTLAALIFVVLLGAFLIWIPVAILLFVAAVVGGLMRRYFLALEHDLVNSNHALRHARACRGHPRLSGGASKTWMEGT